MQLGSRKTNWSLRLHWKDAWCKVVQTEISVSGNEMQSTLKGKGDILIRFSSSRTGFYSSWARPPTWYDSTTIAICLACWLRLSGAPPSPRVFAGQTQVEALVQADRWQPERGSSRASEREVKEYMDKERENCSEQVWRPSVRIKLVLNRKETPNSYAYICKSMACTNLSNPWLNPLSLAQMRGNIVRMIINHMEMYVQGRNLEGAS